MKIASANLQLASSHASVQHHEITESLKMWTGPQRPRFADDGQRGPSPWADRVSISDAGKAAQSAESLEEAAEDALENDPRMRFIRSLIELLTGEKPRVFDAAELEENHGRSRGHHEHHAPPAAQRAAGFGVEYDRHESYTEIEETRFEASGTVKTADGREISFNLELSMSRSYHEESNVSLRLGDAARKVDPLVLNFAGTAAQLTDQRFSFDLNADGQDEQINFVAPGSGFLAFDRNRDGKVNDGSELFGPGSGDGFAELALLDDDQNGWIDENDSAFADLQIWSRPDSAHEQLQSLSEAGVGAISLAQINTPFELKNSRNDSLGQIRNSGIFLTESGLAGSIQQVDLTV